MTNTVLEGLRSPVKVLADGISLVVQWLRLYLPVQGAQVRSLGRELRSHMPCRQKLQA